MKAYRMDDYYVMAANSPEEAKTLYLKNDLGEEEDIDLKEVDIDKECMLFPVKELSEQYHDQSKYPRQKVEDYWSVEITYREAMSFHTEDKPYILSVSSDLL